MSDNVELGKWPENGTTDTWVDKKTWATKEALIQDLWKLENVGPKLNLVDTTLTGEVLDKEDPLSEEAKNYWNTVVLPKLQKSWLSEDEIWEFEKAFIFTINWYGLKEVKKVNNFSKENQENLKDSNWIANVLPAKLDELGISAEYKQLILNSYEEPKAVDLSKL